jgi:uncharacterized membrane protein YqjE
MAPADTAPSAKDTPAGSGERSLGELFSELSNELSTLLRQEMALARAEMSQKLSRAAKDAVFVVIGGVLAFGGYLALIATLIIVLTFLVPLWLSALIVTVVFLVVGFIFVQRGLSDLKKVNPVPERTVESLKEDKEWAKEQLK